MQAGKVECRRLALLCTDNQSNGNILEMEQADLVINCGIAIRSVQIFMVPK